MKEGSSQGCPLSPLFASFVVARLLASLDSLLRARAAARLASGDEGDNGFGGISHLLSYADDISSCVYLPDLNFLCQELQSRDARLGCFVDIFKTRILTSCNGTSILPLLSSQTRPLPPPSPTQSPNSPSLPILPTQLPPPALLNLLPGAASSATPLARPHSPPSSSPLA